MLRGLRHAMTALAVAGALAAAAFGGLASPADAYPFTVSVSSHPVTRPLPRTFLGLALEYGTVPAWTAAPGQPANRVLPALLDGLDPTGDAIIRIGGQSTDRSWWPVRGLQRPLGVTQNLDPAWIHAARTLVAETGAQLMLGVNLEAGNPLIAHVEADTLVRGVGAQHIRALQIGNEPNLYRTIGWYRVAEDHILPWYAHTGEPVFSRPYGWDPAALVGEFDQFARVLPALPLAGPETSAGPWLDAFDGLLGDDSRLRMLTVHAYGLNQCVRNPLSPLYPSIPHLLSLTASRGMFAGIAPSARLARRDGASFRVDEMGSVTCNGRPGVSNTFASALWAMDALFDAARLGINGVNLHSYPNSANGLFDFTYTPRTHRWRARLHPLYDGALMFARAAPAGSRILHTSGSFQTRLRAWATIGADHVVRVLLVNDDVTHSAQVRIGDPSGYTTSVANLQTLRAPSVAATDGVTVGGVPFNSTLTGVAPAPALTPVPASGGARTVTVRPASAALVTIPPD